MKLNLKHYQYMEQLLCNPLKSDYTLEKELGVARQTLIRWKKDEDFQREYKKMVREKWKDSEDIAVHNMIELAKNKDFKALKYILDNLGYQPEQKISADINSKNEININITGEDE